jgi:hypothetical protein
MILLKPKNQPTLIVIGVFPPNFLRELINNHPQDNLAKSDCSQNLKAKKIK